MEANWSVYAKRADFNAIGQKYNIDPVAARVIRNRDIVSDSEIDKYLNGTLADLYDPNDMADMEAGTRLMRDKIAQKKKIRVIADYDVDGVMSGYILTHGLRALGADVSCRIPHRMLDGYGVNTRLIEEARADGVDTVITCDNGISAYDAIALAKSYGMTVIVTDHHTVPYELDEEGNHIYRLVPADAVIDIHRADCPYPYKGLCGAGVAYKYLQALHGRMGVSWENENAYVPFVALATVCDIMDLTDENRIFVRYGLEMIKKTDNIGMRALLSATDLSDKQMNTHHFGFVLGPCINAVGRLGDAGDSLALFFCEDEAKALEQAKSMAALNVTRKSMTEEGVAEAVAMTMRDYPDDKVLVLYMPKLHESLAGIVAGKVKDHFYRPTIVLTDAECEDGEALVKGSGRSVEGYQLYDALYACRDRLVRFGGHALAAGMTLQKADVDGFRAMLNEKQPPADDVLVPTVQLDVPMPMSYISPRLISDLERLEPFGKGNAKPLFGQIGLRVKSASVFGANGQYVRMQFTDADGFTTEGVDFNGKQFLDDIKMWFNDEECDRMLKGLPNNVRLDVAYYPGINSYRGRDTIQVKPVLYRRSQSS